MTARDESARDDGPPDRRPDLPLPAIGDFRALVERLPLIIYVDGPDAESPSLYMSPQAARVLGHDPEEWASSPEFFQSIVHADDRERVMAETARMLAGGTSSPVEYRVLRGDGSIAWIRDEGVLVRDQAGKPLCTQGYMLDITERKEREAALRQSEARMRAMLGAALDGVITIDSDGAIIEFNAAAERIFGYARDAVLGRQMVDLIVPPPCAARTRRASSATPRRARARSSGSASRCRRCAQTAASSRWS